MRLDCRSSIGLGETETPILNGTQKVSHAPETRAKASQESGPDVPAILGGGALGSWQGPVVAHPGDIETAGRD